MKLLLCKSVAKLGIVGDIVEVAPGYARNYLVPLGLATEPTDANMRSLAEARRVAEDEREQQRAQLKALAERLESVELTIRAKANESGHLYGSVGRREISAALEQDEQYFVEPEQILLADPIIELDNITVEIRLAEDIRSTVKVWVVREKGEDEDGEEVAEGDEQETGKEAGTNGDDSPE